MLAEGVRVAMKRDDQRQRSELLAEDVGLTVGVDHADGSAEGAADRL